MAAVALAGSAPELHWQLLPVRTTPLLLAAVVLAAQEQELMALAALLAMIPYLAPSHQQVVAVEAHLLAPRQTKLD